MGGLSDAVSTVSSPTDDSFTDFVRPHWSAMARLARRLAGSEWEDNLQDALALAWRRRDTFDAQRGTARTWLLTLVVDQARKGWRRQRTDVPSSSSSDLEVEPVAGDGVDIERAVAALPARQRLAVTLFYFLDLSVADTAVVMRCAPGTVKSTLAEARRRLRDHLGSDYA